MENKEKEAYHTLCRIVDDSFEILGVDIFSSQVSRKYVHQITHHAFEDKVIDDFRLDIGPEFSRIGNLYVYQGNAYSWGIIRGAEFRPVDDLYAPNKVRLVPWQKWYFIRSWSENPVAEPFVALYSNDFQNVTNVQFSKKVKEIYCPVAPVGKNFSMVVVALMAKK
jgi:hypothetical protein